MPSRDKDFINELLILVHGTSHWFKNLTVTYLTCFISVAKKNNVGKPGRLSFNSASIAFNPSGLFSNTGSEANETPASNKSPGIVVPSRHQQV
jgi:hypothetical protein